MLIPIAYGAMCWPWKLVLLPIFRLLFCCQDLL